MAHGQPFGIVAVDHVGVAVAEPQHPLLAMLGDASPEGRTMPSGVKVGRFGPGSMLELVWPACPGSPIAGFLQRQGPGLHHVALRIDMPVALVAEQLGAMGIAATGSIEPSADGRPSLFLHPRTCGGVLVELVEGAS